MDAIRLICASLPRQGAGCLESRVFTGAACLLYSAKLHPKTEVMGKTDMEKVYTMV